VKFALILCVAFPDFTFAECAILYRGWLTGSFVPPRNIGTRAAAGTAAPRNRFDNNGSGRSARHAIAAAFNWIRRIAVSASGLRLYAGARAALRLSSRAFQTSAQLDR
jgi:hypothetical protein